MIQKPLTRAVRRALGCSLVLLLLAPGAQAGDAASKAGAEDAEARRAATRAAVQANTEAVRERIEQSADFLAAQKRFSFTTRNDYDVRQVTGQKLEFGGDQTVTVRRPDRLRVDKEDRNGDRRSTFFDGTTVSIDLPDADAYVAIEKPGSLDDAVSYIVDDLETPVPLHEFVTDHYFDSTNEKLRSGFFVATEKIGEEICDHVAFQTDTVDIELWIRIGDEPLPCRVVITYRKHEGQPQFAAEFETWDLEPEVPDELFSFTPPKSADRLTLQAAHKEIREAKETP